MEMSTTQLEGMMIEMTRLGLPARFGQARDKAASITHRDVRLETDPPQKIIGALNVTGQGALHQFYRCSSVTCSSSSARIPQAWIYFALA
jgi:hypothetical protein